MVKPLVFKGDKPKKRKRLPAETDDTTVTAPEPKEAAVQENEEDDSWVSAEAIHDITGPVIFVLPTDPASCLACDAHGKIFASDLENIVDGDPATAEPHDVRQVWVANRVAGTESFSFKGHHGRYLGCDKFGIVSAKSEAISPEQSFLCLLAPSSPGTFALQTPGENFVSIVDGKETAIRGDAEEIDFNSTLRIRMQARFKPRLKASKEEKAKEKISRRELQEAVGRLLDDAEVKVLKKARREGNFHEALLDVKVKGKHDKFA